MVSGWTQRSSLCAREKVLAVGAKVCSAAREMALVAAEGVVQSAPHCAVRETVLEEAEVGQRKEVQGCAFRGAGAGQREQLRRRNSLVGERGEVVVGPEQTCAQEEAGEPYAQAPRDCSRCVG